jgi:hypothetical protein
MGIVLVAALAATADCLSARRDDHRDLSLDKIKCQRLHPVVLALRPAILNDNVAAIEVPDFLLIG